MNCWRFDARIFDACRDVPQSAARRVRDPRSGRPRGRRGACGSRPFPARGPVLDLSRRADAADVSPAARRRGAVPVTGGDVAAALVARGLDPARARAKASLYHGRDRHVAACRAAARRSTSWWVPGRLEVFGKHTDYAGGRTLVCAVPRGFAVVGEPARRRRRPGRGRVARQDVRSSCALDATPRRPRGWRHYVEVAVAPARAKFSRRGARRRHRDRERPAARVRHEQLERAGRRDCGGAGRVGALPKHRRAGMAREHRGPVSTRPAITPASRTACRSAALPGTPGSAPTAAARTTPRSSRARPRMAVGVRLRAGPRDRRGADAGRLAIRHRAVRRRRAEDRRSARALQPARRPASHVLLEAWNARRPARDFPGRGAEAGTGGRGTPARAG